jgi:16S rRNA (guanine1516-N2)-methyltransferase
MFPQKNKSALVKKDMQLLAKLVGKDISNDSLLETTLTKAKHRVVVKRHKLSPLLTGKIPQYQILGKTNRFDIYLCSSQTPDIN